MNSVIHFFTAGGWVMWPLLVLSLTAVTVIVERSLAYRKIGNLAAGLLESVVRLCEQNCL